MSVMNWKWIEAGRLEEGGGFGRCIFLLCGFDGKMVDCLMENNSMRRGT